MLIVLEGADGTGKNTQRKLLEEHLSGRGLKVRYRHYPDYDNEYGKLLKGYLDMERELDVKEQFLLYIIDIVKDSKEVAKEMEEGYIEIMDRYYFSTVAYQSANGFGYENAKQIIGMLGLRKPDIAFHIDMPVEVSMERKERQKVIDENSKSDRHEADASLQEKVRKYYKRMVDEGFGASRWIVVDGTKTPGDISRQIASEVDFEITKNESAARLA